MSILDFTTGLFREPANLRSFVDDPDQALKMPDFPMPRPTRCTTCFRWWRLPNWTSTSSSPTSITTMKRS
jgi:hypothetical protein